MRVVMAGCTTRPDLLPAQARAWQLYLPAAMDEQRPIYSVNLYSSWRDPHESRTRALVQRVRWQTNDCTARYLADVYCTYRTAIAEVCPSAADVDLWL